MAGLKDISGQHFGRLTAICPTEKRQGTNIIWRFQCECGEIVERTTSHIPIDAACQKCKPRGTNLRKDYTGKKFGKLTAVSYVGKRNKDNMWLLQCECGNTIELPVISFCGGNTLSCGCLRREQCRENSNYENLADRSFGKLTVIRENGRDKKGQILWDCRCACGNEVTATTSELHGGRKLSCEICENVKRYCVYKHEFPDGKPYFGLTADAPWHKWTTGSRYQRQKTMKTAIEDIGGYTYFLQVCKHYYYTRVDEWIRIEGPVSFFETNVFTKEEAKYLKQRLVKQFDTMNPEKGLNSTSGALDGFHYSEAAKKRQSDTKTGEDGRTDWKVYIHRNKTNGKVYVGITCRPLEERWNNGKGYNPDSHFGRAIQKYGWDGFEHEIVRENLCRADANEHEKKLIQQYDSTNREKGYNTTEGGDGSAGMKHTDETKTKLSEMAKERIRKTGIVPFQGRTHTAESKAKMSESHRGKNTGSENPFYGKHWSVEKRQKYSKMNSKAVDQYDLSGNFIQRFPSGKAAAEALNITPSAISASVKGKTKSCHGFVFRQASVAVSGKLDGK